MKRTLTVVAAVAAFGILAPTAATAAPAVSLAQQVQAETVTFTDPVWDEVSGAYKITAKFQGDPKTSYRLTVQNGSGPAQDLKLRADAAGVIALSYNVAPGATLAITYGGQVLGSIIAPTREPGVRLFYVSDGSKYAMTQTWVEVKNFTPNSVAQVQASFRGFETTEWSGSQTSDLAISSDGTASGLAMNYVPSGYEARVTVSDVSGAVITVTGTVGS